MQTKKGFLTVKMGSENREPGKEVVDDLWVR